LKKVGYQLVAGSFLSILISRIFRNSIDDFKVRIGQAEIAAKKSYHQNFVHLWDAEVKVFSQWGEDGIIEYLCDVIELTKPKMIEFGAGNFTECNSRFLTYNRGASAVLVDGRRDLVKSARRQEIYWKSTIIPITEWIRPSNVNKLIEIAKKELGGVDIISFDLDGNDYWIMKESDLSGAKVIIVEYNPLFGWKFPVSVKENSNFDRTKAHYSWLFYGASILAFVELLASKGFIFVGSNRVGNNAFFLNKNKVANFPLELPKDLEKYVDWRVRESRDKNQHLDYKSIKEAQESIFDMELINVSTNKATTVKMVQ
jgi:hypothetical protein